MSEHTTPPELLQLRDNSVQLRLFPWEDSNARRVGEGRTRANLKKKNRGAYDESKLMLSDMHADIHAVVAEIGVARYLGGYCHLALWNESSHNTYSDLPDVLWGTQHVEVKWRRSGYRMPVDRKDADRDVLVIWAECRLASFHECVCDFCGKYTDPLEQSAVRILGGGYASELWEKGKPYKEGDESRVGVYVRHLVDIKSIMSNHVIVSKSADHSKILIPQ